MHSSVKLIAALALSVALIAYGAWAYPPHRGMGYGSTSAPPTGALTGILLGNNTFVAPAADGTNVGAITIQGTNVAAATLSIIGTDAAKFRLSNTTVPSNLLVSGTQNAGTYSISIVATLAGAVGSPKTVPETITGTSELAAGYYVDIASRGGTCNDGYPNTQGLTATTPFCSLGRAQTAMRATSTKLTYVRAGTYTPNTGTSYCGGGSDGLDLNSSDSGETFQYYPPDGYNTAILNGQGSITRMICAAGASNITIRGLTLENGATPGTGIALSGVTNSLITDNILHDFDLGVQGDGGNLNGTTFTHNYVYNTARSSFGMIGPNSGTGGLLSNTTVSYNFSDNVCSNDGDCGAVYNIEYGVTPKSTNIQAIGNYFRNVYINGNVSGGGRCVYWDEGISNATAKWNICSGVFQNCPFTNGGNSDTWNNNICDGLPGQWDWYANLGVSDMSNNNLHDNINVTNGARGSGDGYVGGGPNAPIISNNLYWNYANRTNVNTGGSAGSDSNPVKADPKFQTCPGGGVDSWSYKLDPTSPALGSPVSFTQPNNDRGIAWGMPGYWGPPGFTIPHTGTAPSYGPTC